MFALVIERDPLKLADLPGAVQTWVQAVGGFAVIGLVLALVAYLARRGPSRGPAVSVGSWVLGALSGGAVLALLPVGLLAAWNALGWGSPSAPLTARGYLRELFTPVNRGLLYYGAACAVMAVLLPVLRGVGRLRPRRIWAMAKLSFKEAIRRRVLWGFSALLLVFLFASWFLPYKPEDQVRNYVRAVYWAMAPLLLTTAGLLAAFSIPADVRNQTIHTIVTKPVERFEIVLGRFLGYAMLMTLVLAVMTCASLVYVYRGVDQEAADESLKAREPVYGELDVTNPKNVGYEWEYRQYLTGGARDEQAIWTFRDVPRGLGERDTVRCEITFDIFRTTKGEENKGIYATFVFENARAQGEQPGVPLRFEEYQREKAAVQANADSGLLARAQQEGWSADKLLAVQSNALAEKYGIYELPAKEIVDFHTQAIELPAGLFKGLEGRDPRKDPRPPLRVVVRCDSRTQYLGVARYDLYLLLNADGGPFENGVRFGVNFFKGAAGLWLRLLLVIGVAVTCSTYLSGVIAFLATMFLYLGGLLLDFARTVAEGKAMGGGPLESLIRITSRAHPAIELEKTPGVSVAQFADHAFEWALGRILNLLPDVERFDLTDHVAEGFNIPAVQLLLSGLLLAAYLLPWAVLAYYLIRSREVAA